jgi:hypothetical protein
MKWVVLAASLIYVPNVPGGVIGPNPSLFSGPSSGAPATTGALLLVDGTDNVLLVDGTDNLCLTGSSSC